VGEDEDGDQEAEPGQRRADDLRDSPDETSFLMRITGRSMR
jgi:hypothetical protein